MNTQALIQLWNCTQRHHGASGARAAAGVLLGLYNGDRFPFDLVDLRVMDQNYLDAAIEVIRCDATRCQREVHEWLNQLTGRRDFGMRFERLAHEYRRKGRCKLIHLDPVSPENLLIEQPEPIGKQIVRSNPAPMLS